jgi:hypothetical protein
MDPNGLHQLQQEWRDCALVDHVYIVSGVKQIPPWYKILDEIPASWIRHSLAVFPGFEHDAFSFVRLSGRHC